MFPLFLDALAQLIAGVVRAIGVGEVTVVSLGGHEGVAQLKLVSVGPRGGPFARIVGEGMPSAPFRFSRGSLRKLISGQPVEIHVPVASKTPVLWIAAKHITLTRYWHPYHYVAPVPAAKALGHDAQVQRAVAHLVQVALAK